MLQLLTEEMAPSFFSPCSALSLNAQQQHKNKTHSAPLPAGAGLRTNKVLEAARLSISRQRRWAGISHTSCSFWLCSRCFAPSPSLSLRYKRGHKLSPLSQHDLNNPDKLFQNGDNTWQNSTETYRGTLNITFPLFFPALDNVTNFF